MTLDGATPRPALVARASWGRYRGGVSGTLELEIRPELPGEAATIRSVHEAAFGQPQEGALVDALRAAGALSASWVALEGGEAVAHVAFSPVRISPPRGEAGGAILGLAPMAVHPDRQRGGLGTVLLRRALAALGRAGTPAVIVLGHAEYYPRFAFVPASRFGLRWDHDAPDEAFMALELIEGALSGPPGVVSYHSAFEAL